MTTYNKSTLKTFFEQGDIPSGNNYADLIDSQINIVETAVQVMGGALNPTELITTRVSATNGNFTGTMNIVGITSVDTIYANNIITTSAINLPTMTVTGDLFAGNVYTSAVRNTGGVYNLVTIVSATGTTQATAAVITGSFVRGQGAADGQTTGFLLASNRAGWVQYFVHEGAVSANLWPPTGGTINALSSNTPFPLVANTPYTIFYKTASAYAVK